MNQLYSEALLALSPQVQSHSLAQLLSHCRIQVVNRTPINTKESLLIDLETYKPNFLLVSSTLPGVIELTEVVEKTKLLSPRTKVVLFINEYDVPKIQGYLLVNSDAIIWTEGAIESLEFALRQLVKGNVFICGRSAKELRTYLQNINAEGKSDMGLLSLLTEREIEVLQSLTHGINYKQISKLLFISESTVKTHINNIFTKLNVNDRTQAVLYALKHGIESLAKNPYAIKKVLRENITNK